MNILFLTLINIVDVNERGIYNDLMRKFAREGHNVCIVCPVERSSLVKTKKVNQNGIQLLNIKTLNIQKTNFIEKGIGILLLEYQFLWGINKYFKSIKFDLILYSTPPITYNKIIRKLKKDGAKSYLLLKDIFPQNAVDLGLIRKSGILHKYFLAKEKQLYNLSDYIGCMSQANLDYVLKNNLQISSQCIEVNPNSIDPNEECLTSSEIEDLKIKYGIKKDTILFLYGGNLGLPQGIDFLLSVLNEYINVKNMSFAIVGDGTMFSILNDWFVNTKPENAVLINKMNKKEYDKFIHCSDVGMIFLDKRFTIPNYPSRLLSYMEAKKPVLLATDRNSDIGIVAEKNKFGFWSESGDLDAIKKNIQRLAADLLLRKEMGERGYNYLLNNYTTVHSYKIIMKHFENV